MILLAWHQPLWVGQALVVKENTGKTVQKRTQVLRWLGPGKWRGIGTGASTEVSQVLGSQGRRRSSSSLAWATWSDKHGLQSELSGKEHLVVPLCRKPWIPSSVPGKGYVEKTRETDEENTNYSENLNIVVNRCFETSAKLPLKKQNAHQKSSEALYH